MEVALGRAPVSDVRQHYRIFTAKPQSPREARGVGQLSRDRDLRGQDLDAFWDASGADLAEVLGRDDLERKTVMDGGHQLAILRHHPISSGIHPHGGADDRCLLARSRGEYPELALAPKR